MMVPLHKLARTTPAVRAEIAASTESASALASSFWRQCRRRLQNGAHATALTTVRTLRTSYRRPSHRHRKSLS